jgi:hypothetical protein
VPVDLGRFTPALYPEAPPLLPATGPRHHDTAIEEVVAELIGTPGEAVFEAWCAARTRVTRLGFGTPTDPGRVVGPDARGVRVVSERYAAEDPRLLLPSIVHGLLWSGPGAGHAEETLLHALGAYVHAALLARDPTLAGRSELARRQSSITITLLNSRRPGSATITLVAPDGPGTVPGGEPLMQTPDFWSVPFGPAAGDGAPLAEVVRGVLAGCVGCGTGEVPRAWDDELGRWMSDRAARLLAPEVQLAANRALGLLP